MGIFDWFGRKPPATRASPASLPPEYLALIETTRAPYAAIEVGDGDARDPRASKLGGVPYRPVGGRHDALLARDEMVFVAQIRCAELPALPAFPGDGLLQFWLVRRDLTDGVGQRADGRTCLYYASTEEPQLADWVPAAAGDDSPLTEPTRGRPLSFTPHTECMPAGDYQWRALLERSGLGARHAELRALARDSYQAEGDRVGGYCAFTQDDPRSPADPMVSLLQLDTTAHAEWGDTGIAHWFLREADLRACAFEATLFYWDCC